ALRGCYLFGDNGGGNAIWAIDPSSPAARRTLQTITGLTTFGEDSSGEIYFAASGGVYKLVPTAASVPAVPLPALAAFALLVVAVAAHRLRGPSKAHASVTQTSS